MLTQLFHHTSAPTAKTVSHQAVIRTGGVTLPITLHSLSSSLLESAGHDGAQTLILVFRALPGAVPMVCTCDGVPVEIFEQLIAAPSPGRFYSMSIWNRYPSEPATLAE